MNHSQKVQPDVSYEERMAIYRERALATVEEQTRLFSLPVVYERDDDLRYVRSALAWRRPVVHILEQTRHGEIDGEPRVVHATLCKHVRPTNANVYDAVPEGMTVCQPCAERLASLAVRSRQQADPQWEDMKARTERFLEEAAVNGRAA